jgi:hypothetical protein
MNGHAQYSCLASKTEGSTVHVSAAAAIRERHHQIANNGKHRGMMA